MEACAGVLQRVWCRVSGLLVHAGLLGVLIGEYVKPGYKLRKRAHIGLPELRTKKQEPRTKKQEARTKQQETKNKKASKGEVCFPVSQLPHLGFASHLLH